MLVILFVTSLKKSERTFAWIFNEFSLVFKIFKPNCKYHFVYVLIWIKQIYINLLKEGKDAMIDDIVN